MDDSLPIEPFDEPLCVLCHRTLSSENDHIDLDSVSISICGDCKFLYLEDNHNTTPSQHITRTTPRIRRSRYTNSSESIEEIFSRQLSAAINLNPTSETNTSSRTTPNGSRRWRRIVSDTESEGFGSVYSENYQIDLDSYSGDSEASVDVHSFLGGDSDTDIDPMQTGLNLNQWSSDEEDNEWEDGENGENTLGSLIARVHLHRSLTSDVQTAEIEGGIRVRISERRHVNLTNPFGTIDDDHETSPYVGHSGDYLDSRSFEELLERLAEADNPRRGPPPAAISVVNNLDFVTVNDADHIGLSCAICKDGLTVGTVVNRLPCSHLYHTLCIKPWLSSRNTCPLCRFELPTDDIDYENTKQNGNHGSGIQEIEPQEDETSFEEHERREITNDDSGRRTEGTSGRRWLSVAAPVVALIGIGLALWLGNPANIPSSGSCGSSQRGNRSRRWWGLF